MLRSSSWRSEHLFWMFRLNSVALILKVTMTYLVDWMPLAPLTDEELCSRGVGIKEELNDVVTEETCLDIKDEPLDYGEEVGEEVSDRKVKSEGFFFQNLHELRYEANETDSHDLVQDGNGILGTPFLAEDSGSKCSSDGNQSMYKESHEGDIQTKVEATLKRHVCDVCGKKFSSWNGIKEHMRGHTKENRYMCDICNKTFFVKGRLVRHMIVHSNKPFRCDTCKKHLTVQIKYKCENRYYEAIYLSRYL
ncbi:zinc finger protein 223-like [Penaeus vannamei]|uniref:zinc finger protein 223-like n=1 Tax=Penaeus vannamei TaxID=6689 RepID=UPI00387FA230